jgi:hypothetical protein
MKTITLQRDTQDSKYDKWQRPISITLPCPPFDIPPACIDETAPTAPTIRGERHWKQDSELRLAAWRAGK